jgi:hypothetical protein
MDFGRKMGEYQSESIAGNLSNDFYTAPVTEVRIAGEIRALRKSQVPIKLALLGRYPSA